jgi:hypothetical protein
VSRSRRGRRSAEPGFTTENYGESYGEY